MYAESALFLQRILLASRPTPGGQDGARAFWFEELSPRFLSRPWRVGSRSMRKEIVVTDNSAFKKLVRARMAETGEKYTEARRNVLAASGGSESPALTPVQLSFPAETFTAIVGAGGMTNLGLVMPHLIDFARSGHPVVIAAHEGEASAWNLASPFDFLIAENAISIEELAGRLTSGAEEDRAYLRESLNGFPMTFMTGPQSAREWIAALAPIGEKHAVLYVPDLQVDLPLSDWPRADLRSSLSDFDVMPAQLAGLKSIAREARAAVIGGHCMPAPDADGWRVVADIADDTIVMEGRPSAGNDSIYESRLDFYSRWADDPQPVRQERTLVDVSFDRWRFAANEERKAA